MLLIFFTRMVFGKLDQKAYTYDVAWYENTNGEVASWINSDGSTKTYNTKTDFINDIIVPAMNEFNNKIPGYSFTYSGYTYGTSSSPYKINDGKSVIQIYRQNSGDGGGAAWWGLGYDEFGYKIVVGNTGSSKNGISLHVDTNSYIVYFLVIKQRIYLGLQIMVILILLIIID